MYENKLFTCKYVPEIPGLLNFLQWPEVVWHSWGRDRLLSSTREKMQNKDSSWHNVVKYQQQRSQTAAIVIKGKVFMLKVSVNVNSRLQTDSKTLRFSFCVWMQVFVLLCYWTLKEQKRIGCRYFFFFTAHSLFDRFVNISPPTEASPPAAAITVKSLKTRLEKEGWLETFLGHNYYLWDLEWIAAVYQVLERIYS